MPAVNPYTANSKHIGINPGYGGILKITCLSNGAKTPIRAAHHGPHKYPANNTGICIGESILPICGIWPVKNGSNMQSAKHMAE